MPVPDRTVTHVSWRDLFPWLIIFRSLPIAASVTVLAFATLGVVATPIGWLMSEGIFLNDAVRMEDAHFKEFVETNRSPYRGIFDASQKPSNYVELFNTRLSGARAVYERMVLPFRWMFKGNLGFRKFAYLATGCLWMIAVWSFSGLAITRYALLHLTRDETLPIDETFMFGWSRWGICLTAFGSCILVAVLLCLPMAVIGLFLSANWSSLLGALLWFVVALCAIALALLLFGLMFAWPMVVTSVATENQNALDALTRSYAYVFQRPLNYALYGFISLLFGGFCWLIVFQLATRTIELGFWGASWGANVQNEQRMDEFIGAYSIHRAPARYSEIANPVRNLLAVPEQNVESQAPVDSNGTITKLATKMGTTEPLERPFMLRSSASIIRFVNSMISTIAVAFMYGVFWCMASAVYLLLRRDVDEVELDEIYLDDESRSYELPPLKSDEHGIPQIQPLDEYQRRQSADGDSPSIHDLGE